MKPEYEEVVFLGKVKPLIHNSQTAQKILELAQQKMHDDLDMLYEKRALHIERSLIGK